MAVCIRMCQCLLMIVLPTSVRHGLQISKLNTKSFRILFAILTREQWWR